MAFTVTAADDPAIHAVRIRFAGYDPAHEFKITRPDYNTPSRPHIIVHNGPLTNPDVLDYIAPFNVDITYTIKDKTANKTVTAKAELTYPQPNPAPAIDTSKGEWPILRAPLNANLGYFRVPILDYTADFGFRSVVHHVLSSPFPVVSNDVMELKAGTMQWATSTSKTRRHMLDLFNNSARVLHLRSPCIDGALDDLFFVITALNETATVRSRPDFRVWTVTWQQVVAPPTSSFDRPIITNRATWGDIQARSGPTGNPITWGDVLNDYKTWFGVSLEVGSTAVAYAAPDPPYVGSL